MGERLYKVNEQIKHEVGAYIQEHLRGQQGLVTITAVESTPDLRNAKVWIGYIGDARGSAIAELRRHTREIQTHLNSTLTMKNIPRITFLLDQSGDYAQKISKIIDESL